MNKILPAVVVLFSFTVVGAYEWKSHNRMAYNARDIFVGREETHQPPFPIDKELTDFLKDYATDIDTRAGDPFDKAFTDEDATEGRIGRCPFCIYTERPCAALGGWAGGTANQAISSMACTRDHFYPVLRLPLGQETAIAHARRYFRWAVALYEAGKCSGEEKYLRWSARALGHAIHLVHDMSSPQHVRPETHAPYPLGNGKSFIEYWALDVWDRSRLSAGQSRLGVLTAYGSGSTLALLHRSC